MSVTGTLFTFGNSAGGRLGRGEDAAPAPTEVTTFLGDNQRDEIHSVKIGYVSRIYDNNMYDVVYLGIILPILVIILSSNHIATQKFITQNFLCGIRA